MPLTDEQIDRYSRQIILPEVGGLGQEKLLAARVWLAGGPSFVEWAARHLAAAGIGQLRLSVPAAGLEASLAELNPDCLVAVGIGDRPDVALLGGGAVDPATVEDFWRQGVPVVVAIARDGVSELTAVVASHEHSPCFRCAAGEPGSTAPLSSLAVIAMLAVTEVIKLLLPAGTPLYGRRLRYDARTPTPYESAAARCPHRG